MTKSHAGKDHDGNKTLGNGNVTVKDDQSIEIPTTEISQAVSVEAFMNELLIVEVATTTDENQPPSIVLTVNGLTQPVFRGVPTRMRRMFVEVLARCKESKYSQHTNNPNQPDRIELRSRSAHAYPFQVLHDPNPKGRAWLRAVMSEAG